MKNEPRLLRIAMLSVHTCPIDRPGGKDVGGMNVYVRELAARLGKRGHRVDVFTQVHDLAEPQIMDMGPGSRLVHIKAIDEGSVEKLSLYPFLPDFACNLARFVQEEDSRYDAIYSHYWLSGLTGKILSSWWRVPQAVMFHTLGKVKSSLGIGEEESDLRVQGEESVIAQCDRIIASTEREKEYLVSDYAARGARINIVPCGVNMDLFQPMDRTAARLKTGLGAEKVVLFAGRIDPIKALDRLIESVGLLRKYPDLKLLIVGGDGYERGELERLKTLSDSLGLSGHVEFRKPVPQPELIAYYSAADVFVLPSHHESFGMVALEAMACGTPVVSGPIGDLVNIIRPGVNGYVARDNSPPNLASAISYALETRFAPEAVRGTVAEYGWEAVVDKTASVLAAMAGPARRRPAAKETNGQS